MRIVTSMVNAETARRFQAVHASIEDTQVAEGAFDHVFTDPPYAERTQANTRRGRKTDTSISEAMPLGFDHATSQKRARWATWIARATRRWVGVFSDHESSMDWAAHLERAGLVYVRCLIWVRTGDREITADRPGHSGTPQFTGDRPPQDHECIVMAHKGTRMRWNGHGKAHVFTAPVVPSAHRLHTTEKPVSLMIDLLRDYCRPEETLVDPFCGAGATMVAARMIGMAGAAGIDNDSKYASLASRRAAGGKPYPAGHAWSLRR